MPKTRGRKRHGRSTRKMRRPCKRSIRRSTRRNKMRGGRSNKPTTDEMEGIPLIKGADITIDGVQGTYSLAAFQNHLKYIEQQGKGGTPGYD